MQHYRTRHHLFQPSCLNSANIWTNMPHHNTKSERQHKNEMRLTAATLAGTDTTRTGGAQSDMVLQNVNKAQNSPLRKAPITSSIRLFVHHPVKCAPFNKRGTHISNQQTCCAGRPFCAAEEGSDGTRCHLHSQISLPVSWTLLYIHHR